MPKFDGTGPSGVGPGTGRGFGNCSVGAGAGRGRGNCPRGFGAGRRFYASNNNLASLQESEKFLADELKTVQGEIKNFSKEEK